MVLRFKLDENLPRRVEPALRELGHEVATAISEGLAGASDPALLAACHAEDRILVTLDLDFAEIRTYPPLSEIDQNAHATFSSITVATMLRLIEKQQAESAANRQRSERGAPR